MAIAIRQLEIQIQTPNGTYGVRIPFDRGMVILQAGNTSGKSTCLQAIVYALGLEGALGPSREVPLTPAVTREIATEIGVQPVIESNIFLEVENSRGERLTVQRTAKGERSTSLITAWNGSRLVEQQQGLRSQDFYVRLEGGATRELGFHSRLAEFIGWDLPLVPKFDGNMAPLYLEAVFPLFYVEQKRGWAAIQSNLPSYLGIRELGKRCLEFVLDLDAYKLHVEREKLKEREQTLRARWLSVVEEFQQSVASQGGRLLNTPDSPTSTWPPRIEPEIELFRQEDWVSISGAILTDSGKLEQLESEAIPETAKLSEELQGKIDKTYERLWERQELAGELLRALELETAQTKAISERVSALRQDLAHSRDVERLKELGSVSSWSISSGHCPTCEQAIGESLLERVEARQPLNLDDNIAFIRDQIKTFTDMHRNAERQVRERKIQLAAVREQLATFQNKIRDLNMMLISDARVPSRLAVREQMELQSSVDSLTALQDDFQLLHSRLEEAAKEWSELTSELARVRREGLTGGDEAKLRHLQKLLIEQEKLYGFRSFDPDLLRISDETYKPTREGYDIGYEASASDNIRLIWGYLYSLLELSRSESMNHLGFLMLDEPKQQELKLGSFREFLWRASETGVYGEQVIFATSEDPEILAELIDGRPYKLISFSDLIFQRLS